MVDPMRDKSDSELEELQAKHQARLERIAELREQIARERSLLETERQQLKLDEERTLLAMAFHSGSHEINGEFRNLFYHLGRLGRMLVKHDGATREVNSATDAARQLRQKNDHLYALMPSSFGKRLPGEWTAGWLLADHGHVIRASGTEVIVDDSFRELTFQAHQRSLLTLLSFLVDNAIYWSGKWRYMSDEAKAGRDAPDKPRVTVTARAQSKTETIDDPEEAKRIGLDSYTTRWAVVRVQDNGPGVAADFRELMFLPYTQDVRMRSESRGTGLYLARRCAERLMSGGNGRLELVDSEAGAAFEFLVPLAEEK
jgi:signal transduction histidine kinase